MVPVGPAGAAVGRNTETGTCAGVNGAADGVYGLDAVAAQTVGSSFIGEGEPSGSGDGGGGNEADDHSC